VAWHTVLLSRHTPSVDWLGMFQNRPIWL
jgi:hypothetical protein